MSALPLILVPGLMCDHDVWSPLFPWLSADHLCQVVDHAQADSLQQMAGQLLAGAPPQFLLAGHSMGARVALEVLRLAPERVMGVALMDTGFLPRPLGQAGDDESAKRYALLQIAKDHGVRAMAKQWVRGMVYPDKLDDAELIERILAMFERKTADTFERQIHALLTRPDGSEVLRALRVPTLLMCGAQDAWSPPAQHHAMQALVNPALVHIDEIERAGHMAPMERPAEVAHSLLAWLARCAAWAPEGVVH